MVSRADGKPQSLVARHAPKGDGLGPDIFARSRDASLKSRMCGPQVRFCERGPVRAGSLLDTVVDA